MNLFNYIVQAKEKIQHFQNPDPGKAAYLERVRQGKEPSEIEKCYRILYNINATIQETDEKSIEKVKQVVKDYYNFCLDIIPTQVFDKEFKPIFEKIAFSLKEIRNKINQAKPSLTLSLSAATNINEALDNVQSAVEFYGDPNNMEAFQKLQKNDKQAILQIYNIGKDFLKYSKDIDKNNLKRAQELYTAYLKLIDFISKDYDMYFEPLAEQLGKAIVEKEDALTPAGTTPTPSQSTPSTTKPSSSSQTPSTTTSPTSPSSSPSPIPPGPTKPIGVTGGSNSASKKSTKPTAPTPRKKDYKTLLATDSQGNSLYFVRTGPGNYRPAVQADKDAGVQLFARNPNPVARTVYPFIKIQNMPTRRASPV